MSNEYVYVAVDETGNLGKSLKGERYYTLVACVVNDQKTFEDATRRLKRIEEVKFYTNPELREKVLEYAAPTISAVFYVAYPKKKGRSLDKYEQAELHLKMVQSLADAIVLRYGYANDLVVEIDHKDGISDRMVSDIFRMNEYKVKKIISNVVDSRNSYGLQTNDFVVGAIGAMLNNSVYDYVRLLEKEPQPSYIRSENKKAERDLLPPYGRVQAHTDIPYGTGKPSEFPMRSESERKERHQSFPMVSYRRQRTKKDKNLSKTERDLLPLRRLQAHTDIPQKTGKPSGIATGLMGSLRPSTRLGSPVVRLGNPSHTSYKNNSERRRIFGRMRK